MKAIVFMLMFVFAIICNAKSTGTLKEVTENSKKTERVYKDKDKSYPVYKGSRGGLFVVKVITRGKNKGLYRREYIKK